MILEKTHEIYICKKPIATYQIEYSMDAKMITIHFLQKPYVTNSSKIKEEIKEVKEEVITLPQFRLLDMTGSLQVIYSLEVEGSMREEDEIKNMSINILPLRRHTMDILDQMGVNTIGDLSDIIEKENAQKYLRTCSNEIKLQLNKLGLQ